MMRVASRPRRGTVPTPHEGDSNTSRFTPCGNTDRDLLGNCAAVRVPDDIRFLDAHRIEDPHRDVRQYRHRVRHDRGFARPDPWTVEGDDSSASKGVGERRPARHRAGHAVEQQHRIARSGRPRRNAQTTNRKHERIRFDARRGVGHEVART
jgi:hypothetical protein